MNSPGQTTKPRMFRRFWTLLEAEEGPVFRSLASFIRHRPKTIFLPVTWSDTPKSGTYEVRAWAYTGLAIYDLKQGRRSQVQISSKVFAIHRHLWNKQRYPLVRATPESFVGSFTNQDESRRFVMKTTTSLNYSCATTDMGTLGQAAWDTLYVGINHQFKRSGRAGASRSGTALLAWELTLTSVGCSWFRPWITLPEGSTAQQRI